MWNVEVIFPQGHMPVMWNTCMQVHLVTLLISVSSYGVYILKKLSDMCTQNNWHMWHICGICGAYLLLEYIWQ